MWNNLPLNLICMNNYTKSEAFDRRTDSIYSLCQNISKISKSLGSKISQSK